MEYSFLFPLMQKLWKSSKKCKTYCRKATGLFFYRTQCMFVCYFSYCWLTWVTILWLITSLYNSSLPTMPSLTFMFGCTGLRVSWFFVFYCISVVLFGSLFLFITLCPWMCYRKIYIKLNSVACKRSWCISMHDIIERFNIVFVCYLDVCRPVVLHICHSCLSTTKQYKFIEVWQPKGGLHTDNQYIHAYNADRNKIEIGLLKIN